MACTMKGLPAIACLLLAACASPEQRAFSTHVLLPGQMDLAMGPDGNTVIFDAPDGLVVVDTGRHPAHAQGVLDHAQAAGEPVVAVVNTHWHLDHSTGNRDILAHFPQARLVATAAIEGALAGFLVESRVAAEQRLTNPEIAPDARARSERFLAAIGDRAAMVPADPVLADGTVSLGGRAFHLHLAPAAATEADLWLVDPEEGLAVVGDLVVAPVPFFDTGCVEGWRRALAAIDAESWSTLVPGHGAPMTRAGFDRWHLAFDSWLDCAASDAGAGQCAESWMRDAAGFYTPAEEDDVRFLAEIYVTEILRKPEAQMDYCTA